MFPDLILFALDAHLPFWEIHLQLVALIVVTKQEYEESWFYEELIYYQNRLILDFVLHGIKFELVFKTKLVMNRNNESTSAMYW